VGVLDDTLISPSLFTISHNAESTSVACSRSPPTKLSIFASTLIRVLSVVESSIQRDASLLMYILLNSSYLSPPVSGWSALVTRSTHWDVNLLNDSSTMSHLVSM